MNIKNESGLGVLDSLKSSSSFFNSIEPNYDFTVTREMIRRELIGHWDDWRKGGRLCDFFLASELNLDEERNISTQVFRCCIPKYPVDKVLNLLDNDWDKLCWTQRQVKAFVNNYGKKILTVLKIEYPNLPCHLLFLGKKRGEYLLIYASFERNSEEEINYSICGFEYTPMSSYGFLVVPLSFSTETIFEPQEE